MAEVTTGDLSSPIHTTDLAKKKKKKKKVFSRVPFLLELESN